MFAFSRVYTLTILLQLSSYRQTEATNYKQFPLWGIKGERDYYLHYYVLCHCCVALVQPVSDVVSNVVSVVVSLVRLTH